MFRPLLAFVSLVVMIVPAHAASHDVSVEADIDLGPAQARVVTQHCGGIAPETTECSLSIRREDVLGFRVDWWGVTPLGLYTGTLQSTVQWEGGSWSVSCDYVNGLAQGCVASGDRLGMPAVLVHECRSFELASSTPGGAGLWDCDNTHT